MNQTLKKTLSIWFIKDQRAGHINQLQGLADRLAAHHTIETHWLDVNTLPFEWKHGLLKNPPRLDIPAPDVIIGAGHQTHKPLLITSRLYQAFSVVLMKPSLPLNWFDAIICPFHDGLREDSRILNTIGALNKINPEKSLTSNKHSRLMLIGGQSKHFSWDDDAIIEQINAICHAHPEAHWTLSSSPRTPVTFMSELANQTLSNLDCHPFYPNHGNWLSEQLLCSEVVWVTPDSISMIYEALTAGARTALFDLMTPKHNKPGRVAKSIQHLINEQQVTHFCQWQKSNRYHEPPKKIWEADRAAKWLLEKLHSKYST